MPKVCIECGVALIRGQNWTDGQIRSNSNICAACNSKKGSAWYRRNKDKAAQSQRLRNEQFPEKYAEIKRNWRQRNPAKLAIYKAQTKEANRSLTDKRTEKQTPEHIAKRMASSATRLTNVKRICVQCGEEYTPTSWAQRYCSGKCWNAVARKRRCVQRIRVSKKRYAELLAFQEGACAICGTKHGEANRGGRLSVDHCHIKGNIRGLLCNRCNTALGLMRDAPELLRRAADYLERN